MQIGLPELRRTAEPEAGDPQRPRSDAGTPHAQQARHPATPAAADRRNQRHECVWIMLDDALRRRLEALNRQPLPDPPPAQPLPPEQRPRAARIERESQLPAGSSNEAPVVAFTANTPRSLRPAPASRTLRAAAATSLVRPIPGLMATGEVVANDGGRHLKISIPLEQLWARGTQLVTARHRHLIESSADEQHGDVSASGRTRSRHAPRFADRAALLRSFPDRLLYLDLETCGLAGSSIFLIGLLRAREGNLTVELLLARNYSEEKAILATLWETVAGIDVLATFNGKSFDWPMVHDRSTRYLLGQRKSSSHRDSPEQDTSRRSATLLARHDPRPEPRHVDLLHHARRQYRGVVPNCKLLTLEQRICLRTREGDIDGAAIPAAYQQFVEDGRTDVMEAILFHNAIDLVTLLDLSLRCC